MAMRIAQTRHHMLGDPLPNAAILRVVVVNQHGIHAGLAEQQHFLILAMAGPQPGPALLVVVQIARHALFQLRHTHQPADVVGGEPALVFQQQRSELAFVAGERAGTWLGRVNRQVGKRLCSLLMRPEIACLVKASRGLSQRVQSAKSSPLLHPRHHQFSGQCRWCLWRSRFYALLVLTGRYSRITCPHYDCQPPWKRLASDLSTPPWSCF